MKIAALLTPILLVGVAALVAAETPPPNIVFIMADDLGWGDVGYHASEIETPNIDRLARRGTKLSRYYAFPICTPTRAALLTGRSPLRMGITSIGGSLPTEEETLPEVLRKAGYETFMAGKWHLGSRRVEGLPHERGFDHFYGFAGGTLDYYTHRSRRGNLDWQRNGVTVREEGYVTDLLADETIRWIKSRKKPFFVYLAFNAPHTPLQAPEVAIAKYKYIKNSNRRIYAAMVDVMDQAIGRVVQAVDDTGFRDNTLIVFVSDNGGAIRRGGADNQPWRAGKSSLYEGGVRVPGLVCWPGKVPAGKTLNQQLSCHDWLPTFMSVAGLQHKPRKSLDGVDMWPAITKGQKIARTDLILCNGANRCLFRDKWKFVSSRGRTELFDIVADPRETKDLSKEHSETTAELEAALAIFEAGMPTPSGRRRRRNQSY